MSLKKKAVALCCALTLAASMVPVAALGGEGDDVTAPNGLQILREPEIVTAETTAAALYEVSLLSLDNEGKVALREGNYERWVDRVDVPQYALDFYKVLEEAVDNDGDRDYLIASKYFDGCDEGPVFQNNGNNYLTAASLSFDTEAERNTAAREAELYVYAMVAAFDRDHPEVFWLGNGTAIGSFSGYNGATRKYVLEVVLLLKGAAGGDPFDARSTMYREAGKIEQGINLRETSVNAALAELKADSENEAKVKSFNSYLTKNNQYNTNMVNAEARYPLAWECLSALQGCADEDGPVCEGYARAFKVLCDRESIPCVLVDGYAFNGSKSEAHMWNYVKLGNAWYAVDVTWNDPSGGIDSALSGVENEDWLLVGATTNIKDRPFLTTHPVANSVYPGQVAFTNGPFLSARSYAQRLVLPSLQTTATYGDKLADVALPGGKVTDAEGTNVNGTWSWDAGSTVVRTVGTVTHEALFTPTNEVAEPVAVSINVKRKTISVVPGTVNSKTYDGNTNASFSKAPTLSGVLSGDDVKLVATAKFADAAVGAGKRVNITYSLDGPDKGNYTLAATSATATANITAAPAAAKPSTSSSGASASGSSSASKPSSTASSVTAVKAPVLKKLAKPTVKSSKKKQLTVTWKKGATVTWNKVKYAPKAYVVQYSTDAKFKKGVKKATVKVTKVLAKKSKLTTTLKKGLVSKKTYYVRVAAQYKIGGKTYTTPYAVSKKVKVK